MRCKLFQKRSTKKTKECSKHLHHFSIEKYIFSELKRCIFQISLKYIALVIPPPSTPEAGERGGGGGGGACHAIQYMILTTKDTIT